MTLAGVLIAAVASQCVVATWTGIVHAACRQQRNFSIGPVQILVTSDVLLCLRGLTSPSPLDASKEPHGKSPARPILLSTPASVNAPLAYMLYHSV
ncbi:hypothetical protein T440DRAFT_58827 [Plenodomus tracheiphilus IPT5]|uniref:Secreted protein n=1 Tax=Plenodomus tracheiphilus IPT5 TaxID=1408161 RepID=A0A6A7B8L4_9PLEO|nr:hypothetical protein T440DRAFT_58827 [Plenodomus tracheiphilus IPT5]